MSDSINPRDEAKFVDIDPQKWPGNPMKRKQHKRERINKRNARRGRKR